MPGKEPDRLEPARFALSSLIDAMPDAIVVVDKNGRIVDVNTQALGLFGYSRDELLGELVEILVPQDVRDRHVSERDRYVRSPRVRPMETDLDLTGRHKDGREFQVEISLAPHQSPEGLLLVSTIRGVAAHRGAVTCGMTDPSSSE